MPDEGRAALPGIDGIRGFAEDSPNPIVVLGGRAHRLHYINPAFALAAGQGTEVLLYRPVAEILPGLLAGAEPTPLDLVLLNGQPCRIRARPLPLGGTGRLWDAEASALRAPDRSICGVLVQLRDVTEEQTRLRRGEAAASLLDSLCNDVPAGRVADARPLRSRRPTSSRARRCEAGQEQPLQAGWPTLCPGNAAELPAAASAGLMPGPVGRAKSDPSRSSVHAGLAHEARYRALVETGALAVWTAAADGALISIGGWAALTGQSPAEVVGWGWLNAVHPEDRSMVRARWAEAVATGRPYDAEYRVRGLQGNCRWTAARAAALRDAAGRIIEWLGVITDIDDRKRAERALRDSEARFRTLAEAMPHLVWQADASGEPDYVNARWTEVTGFDLQRLRGSGWLEAVHPGDRPVLAAAWNKALREGGEYDADARLRLRDGRYRWYRLKAAPVRDVGGAIRRWVGTCTDIEEQHSAEARLREALVARERLAREADHRIKNSLQMVAALLRLQAGRVAEPAAREALAAATARVQAVAEAHRALQLSPDFRNIRLSDMLRELVAGTAVQHPTADIRVAAPDGLTLDAERAIPLALVLSELVNNALRHARPESGNGPVHVSVRLEEGAILAEVADAGTGLREDATTGLGDTVVRALARQIAAELVTESNPGGGTRVILRLAPDLPGGGTSG